MENFNIFGLHLSLNNGILLLINEVVASKMGMAAKDWYIENIDVSFHKKKQFLTSKLDSRYINVYIGFYIRYITFRIYIFRDYYFTRKN